MATAELADLDFGKISTLDIRGTRIEMFEAGRGKALLFLHGIDGLEASAEGLRELAKSFHVYAPSHPGFGESDLLVGLDRVDDLGYFYLDLLDELGLDRPAIFSTSFGAWSACEMLSKEPGRSSAVVLASPLGLKTAERQEHLVEDIFMLSRDEVSERLQVGEPVKQDLLAMDERQLRRTLRNDEALSLYGWTPYMCNPKLGYRLHRISCPTLILWGEQDAMIAPKYRERWRSAMPAASIGIIPAAGHRIHADKPRELALAVGQFAAGAYA